MKLKATEDLIEEQPWTLLPPAKGLCQCCAVDHAEDQPHNQQSLFWQTWFNLKHGRAPTWADAMAHCPDKVKQRWVEELAKHGVEVHR